MLEHFAATSPAAHASDTSRVPVPLNTSVWNRAVFRTAVSPSTLFEAILSDANAALMAHGLAALDDETLQFFVDRPELVRTLYLRHATVFASFTAHLRIRDGRVVPPGGKAAVDLWEAALGQRVSDPPRFISALYSTSDGRLAYLYDVIAHLDQAHAAFALGLWLDDSPERVARFHALVKVTASIISDWQTTRVPFSRPSFDLLALLQRVQVDQSGAPRFPSARSVWASAVARRDPSPDDARPIDAAWLADVMLDGHSEARSERLDQLAFAHRVFAPARTGQHSDLIAAIGNYPRVPMLMLTLERIGVSDPRLYAALATHAHPLAALDSAAAHLALAQFQGAIVLIERLVRVRSIERATAVTWLEALAAVTVDDQHGYRGGLTAWLARYVRPALGVEGSLDEPLMRALAGPASTVRTLSWEGQAYEYDLGRAEHSRLQRLRQGLPSLDTAIRLQGLAAPRAPRDKTQVTLADVDTMTADALLSYAYAIHWTDSSGSSRLEREMPRRHDFGLTSLSRQVRVRRPWSLPRVTFSPGQPARVEGSLLGLDVALAPLALRRTSAMPAGREPRLLSTSRQSFLASLGLLDVFALQDADAQSIADAIGRGRRRVEALTATSPDTAMVIDEIALDGWRARALRWNLQHAPDQVSRLFSMTELLYLGGGRNLAIDAWGMSALNVSACLCTYVARPGLQTAWIGRHQVGLQPALIPDLNLRVAVVLHELQLPAAIARHVLDAALYDLLVEVKPLHFDDWLTVVRQARVVSRERIEDYLAATTATNGPLVPQPSGRRVQ
jgi:hypothetical protein